VPLSHSGGRGFDRRMHDNACPENPAVSIMKLEKADNALYRIWQKIFRLKYINPLNQEEEKERFLSSKDYNPQFSYERPEFSPPEMRNELRALRNSLGVGDIESLLVAKIDKLIIWLNMLESVGSAGFTRHSINYYGEPSFELVKTAYSLMRKEDRAGPSPEVSSAEAVTYLRLQAHKLGLRWKIAEGKNPCARADDVAAERTLYIKRGERFSLHDLKKLAVHELGVHAARAQNALKQEYKIFLVGTADYEMTEEGLAVVHEERNKVLDVKALRSYAGRVIAVNHALRNPFREVYGHLRRFMDATEAYRLTLRAKRGLSDTAQPGAFTKDYIYLAGWQMLRKVGDVKPLFRARISPDEIQYLE
jgi:uncharacterized protein (TIGR02421 family)